MARSFDSDFWSVKRKLILSALCVYQQVSILWYIGRNLSSGAMRADTEVAVG